MSTAVKAARLNPPTQSYHYRLDGSGRDALGAEDIAYALANPDIPPLGKLIVRVKWAGQGEYVNLLQLELLRIVGQMAMKGGWRITRAGMLERVVALALRESQCIRPRVQRGYFTWRDAVKYLPLRADPGSKSKKRLLLPDDRRIEKDAKLLWARVANSCLRALVPETGAIRMATRVVLGEAADIGYPPVIMEYVPGAEICSICNGTDKKRRRDNKITACSHCLGGYRAWTDAERARAAGMHLTTWTRYWAQRRYGLILRETSATESETLFKISKRLG